MAFSSSVTKFEDISRRRRLSFGTFTNAAGDSGGEIDTGLKSVDVFLCSCSSHLGSELMKVSKNSSTAGKVTIVTTEGADGDWLAVGI